MSTEIDKGFPGRPKKNPKKTQFVSLDSSTAIWHPCCNVFDQKWEFPAKNPEKVHYTVFQQIDPRDM